MPRIDDIDENELERYTETCKTLLKKGGYLLIVGGGLDNLRLGLNPQLIVWDLNHMNADNKEIPTNTRGIVFSRWVSHRISIRLQNAAKKLNIPIFPMAKTREVRAITMELLHDEEAKTTIEQEIQARVVESVNTNTIGESMEIGKRGAAQALVEEFYRTGILKYDESISFETVRRVMSEFRKHGYTGSEGAAYQAIRGYNIKIGKIVPTKTGAPVSSKKRKIVIDSLGREAASKMKSSGMDFEEAERLLRDSVAAISLMLEFLPKIRKEVEAVRAREAKLRALLGED